LNIETGFVFVVEILLSLKKRAKDQGQNINEQKERKINRIFFTLATLNQRNDKLIILQTEKKRNSCL